MIEIQTPDGAVHVFPDGTPEPVIKKVLKQHGIGPSGETPKPYSGPDTVGLETPLLDPSQLLSLPGAGLAGAGAGKVLSAGIPTARAVGRASLAIPEMVGRRLAGPKIFDDMVRKTMGSKPPLPASAPSAGGRVVISRPPARAAAARPKAKPRPAPARPKPQPRPAPVRAVAHRPKTASAPALQRRTTARAAATGHNPPAMGDDGLYGLLQKSVELEQEMLARGLDQNTRMAIRNLWPGR